MKLAFKRRFFGYTEREVPIMLNIGTLEQTCNALEIEFHQIGTALKNTEYDFLVELLYQGYITASCEAFKKGKSKKLYGREKASIWYEHMSQSALTEFRQMMADLMGKLKVRTTNKKKVKARK
jgi:hypothetical protein